MTIDRVPLPSSAGELFLCARADAAPDPDAALAEAGNASLLVCLNEHHELAANYLDYVDWLRAHDGQRSLWHPTRDWHSHGVTAAWPVITTIVDRLSRGDGVLVHCAMGQGRAGTMAVCTLMVLGAGRDEALRVVAEHRRNAGPASRSQWALVDAVDERLAAITSDANPGIMKS
ncbi:MAG: dual specificity protein phosphatase family protein [Ilumatobacteraceae bacterium]